MRLLTAARIKALAICDELSRESIGRHLGRSITADDVVKLTVRGWLKPHHDWRSISQDIHRLG